jgi:hypothetical protein
MFNNVKSMHTVYTIVLEGVPDLVNGTLNEAQS